ncbi:hypothetical protein [Myxosarcina sp. GI1(2024)]
MSDIGSNLSQTLQNIKIHQTEVVDNKNFSEEKTAKKVVHESVQQAEPISEEEDLATESETEETTPPAVVQKVSKIIPLSNNEVALKSPSGDDRSAANCSQPKEIPEDLKEKLRELNIPLDKKVLKAIALLRSLVTFPSG